MIRLFSFLLITLLSYHLYGQLPAPIQLGEQETWSVGGKVAVFLTPELLTPKQAFDKAQQASVTILSGNHLNLGYQQNYGWLYFRLKNNTISKTIIFTYDGIEVHHVACYRQRGLNIDTLAYTGDALPFSSRPIKVNYYAIPIELNANEEVNIVIFFNKRNEFISGYIGLYTQQSFLQKIRIDSAAVSFFIGITFFILLFNLFLWLSLRDTTHLLFMVHITCIVLYVLASLGYGFELFWPNWPYRNSTIMTMLPGLWASTNLFLMKRMLNLTPSTSRFSKAATILGWYILLLSLVCCSIALVQPQPLPPRLLTTGGVLLVIWMLLNIILVLAILIEQIRKRNTIAYLYAIALSFTFLGSLLFTIALPLGIVNVGKYTTTWLMPGFMLEQLTLAFGLTIRYNRFRQQNFDLLLTIAEERNQAYANTITAQETERKRLAADLHDDIGTSLAALRGRITNNPGAEELLNKIMTDVRTVSHNLLPVELHDLGLIDTLNEVARRLETASGIRFLFIASGDPVPLGASADLILYRAVQELMHNIVRHSKATEAVVQLVYHHSHLNITIEDNGCGFDPDVPGGDGIGLKNVSSRIQWLGGVVAVDSGEQGTTIRLDIPFPHDGSIAQHTPAAGRRPRFVQRWAGLAAFFCRPGH